MAASWDFLLCDASGNKLAALTTATGKQIKYTRNNFAEAQLVLSHHDDATVTLMAAMAEGPMPTLRAYRKSAGQVNGTLRFNGYLAPFIETLDETQTLTLSFRSPFGRLYGDGTSGGGRFTGGSSLASEKEQEQIAKSLVLLYGGGAPIGETDPTFGIKYAETSFAGLGIGAMSASGIKRSITYPFANVGQAIINLSACLNGFDFDETFVEQGATLALFNTYVSQGEEKPNARFEYGPPTLSNVTQVTRTTASPITVVRLIGANGLKSEKENAEGIAKYGRWYYEEQVTDVTSQAVLDARAEAIVNKATGPIKTLGIAPDFGLANCPKPWDDFWLGDTVPFYGSDGAFQENLKVRVNELTLVIDENGNETTTIPDPHSPSADPLHTVFKVQA